MKQLIYIVFTLLSTYSFAQKTIRGTITGAETKTTLPYVNIGIQGTEIGTISNEKGEFRLQLKESVQPTDSLLFSFIGFETKAFLIKSLVNKENLEIELTPSNEELEEVVLSGKKPKEKKIGRSHVGTKTLSLHFYTRDEEQDDRLGKEMGMKFNLRGDYRLKNLIFYVGYTHYNWVKFRVNVYRLEDDEPTELLTKEDIIFTVLDIENEWFSVDLNDYNLYLRKELGSFLVTIQWLESDKKHENSIFFSIPAGMTPLRKSYYREKGFAEWKQNPGVNASFYLVVDKY